MPAGTTVLTNTQTHTLGIALKEIHDFFFPLYGSNPWYAMDTEFKFDQPLDDPTSEPVLFVKQARPYPGLGQPLFLLFTQESDRVRFYAIMAQRCGHLVVGMCDDLGDARRCFRK